ncbi:MAG: hypothetical protein KDD56_10035, partial [Bdellovibrionales bacterium]|nr:hypothetical protein [Bdellovibrionales bacterium]
FSLAVKRVFDKLQSEAVEEGKDKDFNFEFKLSTNDIRPDRNDSVEEIEPAIEVEKYIQKFGSSYREILKKLAEQIPPLDSSTKITVCIPVAAHEEQNFIYNTLKTLNLQTLSKDLFEVVILANYPKFSKQVRKIKLDDTMSEIERFKKDFPELKVNVLFAEMVDNAAKIGNIRAILSDVACLRWHERQIDQDHFLMRFDADTLNIHPEALGYYLRVFEKNPNVDGLGGPVSITPDFALRHPIGFVGGALFNLLSKRLAAKTKQFKPQGPNTLLRIGVYAKVGGYLSDFNCGEGVDLDFAVIDLRHKSSQFRAFMHTGASTRLITSERRGEVASTKATYGSQWSLRATEFGTLNKGIRSGEIKVKKKLEE